MNRALPACCAVLFLAAGFGGSAGTPDLRSLSVQIVRSTTYPHPVPGEVPPAPHTETFTMTCDSLAGTLPFAERICGDIAKHPQAMLDPRDLPAGVTCGSSGGLFMPEVVTTVAITFQGDTAQLPQNTDCSDPGSVARELFVLATYGGDAPPAVFTRLEAPCAATRRRSPRRSAS